MTNAEFCAIGTLFSYARGHVQTLFEHYQATVNMRAEERCGPEDVDMARKDWMLADASTRQARSILMAGKETP